MNRYHFNIFWSHEDQAFIADIPDLECCSAHGSTPQDALREVLVAQELWLEGASERGWDIPEPCYRPASATI